MTIRLRLDPEGKEVLEAMLGPLTAPVPVQGCPDLRTSDQRRGEALVEICRRAAAAGGAAPTTTKAALWVTITLDDLATGCGSGSTLGGQLLGVETIRRIACDAMIISVVLGSKSEILDVGRASRLFTPGLLRALWLWDKGCTIPGCTAPPGWADAHQIVHWVDGGVTSLLNGALLCGRHPPPRFAGGTPTLPTSVAGPPPRPPAKSPGTYDRPAPDPTTPGRV